MWPPLYRDANQLPAALDWRDAFEFPLSTEQGRRDVLVGGLLVACLPVVGWVLNLGYRLNVVARVFHDDRPYFRGFSPWMYTFQRGLVSFCAISAYLAPSATAGWVAVALKHQDQAALHWVFASLSAALFALGVFTLPGCMTVYACERDPKVLWFPVRAFRRAWARRRTYTKAWAISASSVVLSFLGLALCGVGFFFTSVWAWEVTGYAFTVAMYQEDQWVAESFSRV